MLYCVALDKDSYFDKVNFHIAMSKVIIIYAIFLGINYTNVYDYEHVDSYTEILTLKKILKDDSDKVISVSFRIYLNSIVPDLELNF